MARTLKRPMFRRGGTVNDGIMTGLEDRKQLANGSMNPAMVGQSARDYIEQFEPLLREFTPKTKLPLGQLGLNLISGKFAGDGLLKNLAGSAQDPYAQFVKADDAREATIRSGAAKLGLGQALKDATPSKSMLANMKKAKIDLEAERGPGNFTREDIVKRASEYNKAEMTGKTYSDQANFRRSLEAYRSLYQDGNKAFYHASFDEKVSPALREQGKAPKGRIKIKDGKYDTKRKTPGVYVDVENGKVIEITSELEAIELPELSKLLI